MALRYTEEEAGAAIAASLTFTEALRRLGMCWSGGNHRTLKKWAETWGIPTDHFDPDAARRASLGRPAMPLSRILVRDSTYSRGRLKERLYGSGLKARICERCGQGEIWRGQRMALILDHINGNATDNRLENLRIVCPNCAATLETHCGRKNARPPKRRACKRCGVEFTARSARQSYCSRECGQRSERKGLPHPGARRVRERPPYEQLVAEIAASSWSAVGRKYGVSDNAIRKWVRAYEREGALVEAERAAGCGLPAPVSVSGAEADSVEPRRILVLRYRDEAPLGRQWAVAQRLGDLPLAAREAGACVRQLLQQALDGGELEPGTRTG
jgi:transposase-like protein